MGRVPRLVSVIVPVHDAQPHLLLQLAALDEQKTATAYEVVVADDGSQDGSPAAARAWIAARGRALPPMRVVGGGRRRGPGAARNAGAAAAEGDLLAFCDADDLVSPTWLDALVASALEADVIGGRLEADRLNGSGQLGPGLTDPAIPHLGFLPVAAGANLAVWDDVLAAVGGFVEHSRTGEDVALVWGAQLRGLRYVASPALVHKRLPVSARDTARRFYHYGKGDAWLYSVFAADGMPRSSWPEYRGRWRELLTGFRSQPAARRRRVWVLSMALTCGRLVGSVRHRVLFL